MGARAAAWAGSRCFRPRSPATRRAPVGRPNCARTNNWWRARPRRAQCTRTVRPNRASRPAGFLSHPCRGAAAPPEKPSGTSEPAPAGRPLSRRSCIGRRACSAIMRPRDTKAANGQARRAPHKIGGAGKKTEAKEQRDLAPTVEIFRAPLSDPAAASSNPDHTCHMRSRRVRRSGAGRDGRVDAATSGDKPARDFGESDPGAARCNAPGTVVGAV